MKRHWLLLVVCAIACHGRGATGHDAGDPVRGRLALQRYSCGACHEITGVSNAHGRVGPVLARLRDQAIIAGYLPNTLDNLVRWIRDPQSVAPGNAMPNLGIDEPTARDMAAYLYTVR
ncbi:MAG: c-type cytochrome [Gemmatimonadales bacterium]